jgi:tetratricopeptide (TPR) repeat protein
MLSNCGSLALTLLKRWQYECGNSHSLRPLAQLALGVCMLCDPSRTKDLLSDIYYTLGAVGTEANDRLSSLHYNKLFLDARLQRADETGIEDVRLGIAHNQFGVSLMMYDNFVEAMDHFQQAIRVYETLPEFDSQYLALPTANLGLAYWLQGKYDEAESTLEHGLIVRETRWGPGDSESFR